jgi:hypothetical protein
MSTHTSGPWVLCFHLESAENDASCPCGYRGGIWGADQERMICEMGSTVTPGQEGMEPARYDRATELCNARLIAAAPTMLDALRAADEALAQITAFEDDARHIMGNTNFKIVKLRRQEVRDAIAKAEGRS